MRAGYQRRVLVLSLPEGQPGVVKPVPWHGLDVINDHAGVLCGGYRGSLEKCFEFFFPVYQVNEIKLSSLWERSSVVYVFDKGLVCSCKLSPY